MPLNKLENFIKNSEGRILYVNPNDLDATDGIENQGNSLTKPFKTLQRALIESARFSYLRGNDNDLVEKTTILLFPGEHLIDNRPGFGIKSVSGTATAISPSSAESGAQNTLTLTLNSNFDLTQEDNILYKFNSTEGGVIVPRGTSIVGLDLRKTKVRPKYVPNPTDDNVKSTAIFRVTGACYFWQFSIFDGDESTTVYTDPTNFSSSNRSKPVFSHHKVTCFAYADGVNKLDQFDGLTDLDVYYSKLSNAYNRASIRDIDEKYPATPGGFSKQRPEYEIVGAFNSDRLQVTSIISGDGATPGQVVTVTTSVPHELTGGTPIKIEGVNELTYNISTKVSSVLSDTQFTYLLPYVPPNLKAGPAGGLSAGSAEVSVEVDTVTGASPYIFNCSLRSVYGMQGMNADGAKATGFRSMVVAQFTGISLQKDDRAFVKYNKNSRSYDGISYQRQTGELLSSESSSLNAATVYHLDKDAVYRDGWKTAHITIQNDAILQIVSVFAIGYHIHFLGKSGGDASITNSNSNFGQFALAADGFKKESFDKDNKGFISAIIAPKAVVSTEANIELNQLDTSVHTAYKTADTSTNKILSRSKLFLLGQTNENLVPSEIAQGYRIGARVGEKFYIDLANGTKVQATICMSNKEIVGGNASTVTSSVQVTSEKEYEGTHNDTTQGSASIEHKIVLNNLRSIGAKHDLNNGESIRIIAEDADLPEGLDPHRIYYAITNEKNSSRQDGISLDDYTIQIASSKTNADRTTPQYIKTVSNPAAGKLKIISRVSDKKPGDLGHPMQFDSTVTVQLEGGGTSTGNWFIHVDGTSDNTAATYNTVWDNFANLDADDEDIPYIQRLNDSRSLDDKLYKFRYVIPKELENARDPNDSFIIQDSSSTNVRALADFTRTSLEAKDYDFNRNTRFISYLDYNSTTKIVTIRSDKSHNLNAGEQIILKNIICTVNASGAADKGYNGTFLVNSIINDKTFTYKTTDILGNVHNVGTYGNDTHTRTLSLPRFERNNNQENLFIYRTETILPYVEGAQDGVYHMYVLNGSNTIEEEFAAGKYNQNVVNLYPELDRDNVNDNPQEASSYAKRFPIGDVVTNDLKKSITRETANKLINSFGVANTISDVTDNTTSAVLTLTREHDLGGLKYGGTLAGGGGHTDGTYYNVKLFDDASAPASAVWKGATAKVVVSGGAVTEYEITEPGSAYKSTLSPLYFDSSLVAQGGIGGAPSSNIAITDANISLANSGYVQVTGISTGTDQYFRVNDATDINKININKTASETILNGQTVVSVGPIVEVSTSSGTDTTTFNCSTAHGLLKGNRFRVLNASDANLGDFIVTEVVDVDSFTALTPGGLTSPKYILKHGLSANDGNSGKQGESLGVRGVAFYDNESLVLNDTITSVTDEIKVTLPGGGTTAASIQARFPLGSFIQVDSEIMRVVDETIGSGTTLKVIRGALGTIVDNHVLNSQIKKIKPLSVELRRPSILRASGHTFEYLGYGPGNYSTGLPQVQLKSLTEREEFLSQSQETSCGTVVYTGMNDKGDFYIGNTKISSDSGEQITFDIPIPTVTGEDPSTLSVVFDEVIIKDRLLVEGGSSNTILSQFNGPVTFNGNVRFNKDLKVATNLTVDGIVKFNNETVASSTCGVTPTGSLVVKGGVSIGDKVSASGAVSLNVLDGIVRICENAASTSSTTGALIVGGGVGIAGQLSLGGVLDVTGSINAGGGLHLPDNVKLTAGGTTSGPYFSIEHDVVGGVRNNIIKDESLSNIYLRSDANIEIGNKDGTEQGLIYTAGAGIKLRHGTTLRFETNTSGAKVHGALEVTDDITAYSTSDARLKNDVKPIQDSLAKVNSISGNTFTWNEASKKEGQEDTGVIAQEISAIGLPGTVTIREDGTYAVDYEKLVPLLLEAIKELSNKVDTLS